MRPKALNWVVALDGGTSNTRARLLHEGALVASSRRSVGARDRVLGDSDRALAVAARDVIRDVLEEAGGVRPDAIVAAGMLASEVGLEAVPHVEAPAGPDELARAAVWRDRPDIANQPILFIPGIRTPAGPGLDGWAIADVMRGEECETLGARLLLQASGPAAFLWPGSHAKLVETDDQGRILASHTSLAGEITAALARHTLLAASLPAALPDDPDLQAADAGARLAQAFGLGRAAFLVRVAALTGAMTVEQRASFWVGAVIGDDVAHLARHPILTRATTLVVGGRQPQRGLYATWLSQRSGLSVEPLSDEAAEIASAIGALEVARRGFAPRTRARTRI